MALAGEIGRLPPMPVPESATVSWIGGLPALMLQVALSVDWVVGVKVMDAVQLAEAAMLAPHVVELTAKSAALAPESAPELRVRELVVVFDTVIVCGVLVEPSLTVPKERTAGDAATPVPSPLRDNCCGLFPALSLMASVAVRVPGTVGLKVTV